MQHHNNDWNSTYDDLREGVRTLRKFRVLFRHEHVDVMCVIRMRRIDLGLDIPVYPMVRICTLRKGKKFF